MRCLLNEKRITSIKPCDKRQEFWDVSLKGFGIRVTKSGEKTFFLMCRDHGRQRRLSLGRYPIVTLAEAREAAREKLTGQDMPKIEAYFKFTRKEKAFNWSNLWDSLLYDWQFWLPASLFLIATILLMGRSHSVNKLKERIAEMESAIRSVHPEFKQAWDVKLKTLSDSLHLNHEDRISVYKYETGKFVLYHRYSDDPEFRKAGRPFYPEDEGCISKAYRAGICEDANFPCPNTNETNYIQAQFDRFNLPAETVRGFKMKSRSYAAYAVFDLNKRDKIAVIVFESINPARFTSLNLSDRIRNEEGDHLSLLMAAWKNVEPSLDYAKRMGF